MQSTKDLYEILGVSRDANDSELKKAFRHKARELHPDVNDSEDAEERFKELNEAYDVLSDPSKRAQYDRFGTIPGGAGGGSAYVNFEDLFSGFGGVGDLFSTIFGGGARSQSQNRSGTDLGIGIVVSLEQAATGVKREVVYDRIVPCEECDFTGIGPEGKEETCSRCNGTGRIVSVQHTFLGDMQSSGTCPECDGTGTKIEGECKECHGQGRIQDRQKVSIDIPAGIMDGQQIRIPGQGNAGFRNGDAGDLIATVRIKDDPNFERQGSDLHAEITIPVFQAILGDKVEIDGILEDEVVELDIPAGTNAGDVLRAKGHGMPKLRSDSRGDLFVHVLLEMPKKIKGKQRRQIEQIASSLGSGASDGHIALNDLNARR